MAKKQAAKDEPKSTIFVSEGEPCWFRYPNKDASGCFISVSIGGVTFSMDAEFTGFEEMESKDLSSLKLRRIVETWMAIQARIAEYLNV